ncbi:SusC/RagA family TonB-linked outer membrane protein [Bacteroides sp. AN502(2024)]|uniref:SusC/RagA family TonB-linked outer membrane protein n=1 Tax=Bacteroides sp. AN502(2024) TaxID=3160599 RepID=UPI003515B496
MKNHAVLVTFQQGAVCKGVVKDVSGESIIGASVIVKGSTNGTITGVDGDFTLQNVPQGSTIVISFVGYLSQEIKFNGQPISIVLKEDNNTLDEVIVVGYGVQKKANLTGSVASINAEALESRSVSSVSAAMAGQMPGVTTIQTSGAPGAQNGSITIRGKNSINAASPLVIVDGIPGSMNNIDPQDIESLSVLKDAASSAIYGVQAANGVILITTKKGKKGQKARVSYSGLVSWSSPTARLKFLGAADYARLYNEATLNEDPNAVVPYTEEDIRKFSDGSDPIGHPDTDWYSEVMKKRALETQHNLSISGGSENTTYMASLGYLYQDGLSKEKNYERYNGRVNIDSKVAKWISLGINAAAYRGINNDEFEGFDSLLQYSNRIAPTIGIYDADGNYNYAGLQNPVAQQGKTGIKRQMDQQLTGNAYINITPLEGLSIKGVYSLRHDYRDTRTFKKHWSYGNFDSGKREGEHKYYNWNWYTPQLLINYNKNFGVHGLGLLGGFEQVDYAYRYTEAKRVGGGNDELSESLNTLDASSQTNKDGGHDTGRLSYFGRIQYDYASKYLFEANLRADASSRFPKNNRWGVFQAFSAGWRISEEAFVKDNVSWLSNLKLRLGWGKTGNEELKSDDIYPAVATYTYGKYLFGESLYSTAYESRYINPDLKWATVVNNELGIEAGFLNNKVGFELSVYKKKTNDMLLYLPILGVIGMNPPAQNAGNVENKGFDLSIFHNNRINKDWSYVINFNVAYVKNRITNMKGTEGEDPDNKKYWRLEGYPIGSFYGYEANGYFNTEEELASYPKRLGNEKLGDIKYVDRNNDGKINAADRTVIGKNFPSWTGGLNLALYYKDFDLSMLWQGAFDVDAYYTGEAAYAFFNSGKVLERHLDRWTPENHNASYPRLTKSLQTNFVTSSFWLQNASYVRLKNISLGYNLPKRWLSKVGLERAKLFLSGENLLTFSGLDGLDPESPSDTRGAFYSNVKKITFGLKVSF